MTDEEYFRKHYPDFCYGDKPLSPYWDFFQDGVEFGERQSENKIKHLEESLLDVTKKLVKRIEELEQKLEQTEKDLADYQFNYPTIKELSKENKTLEGCLLVEQEHTLMLEKENNKLLDVINNQDVKIADLEKQIEKMKCCKICAYGGNDFGVCYSNKPCKNKNKWKLAKWVNGR